MTNTTTYTFHVGIDTRSYFDRDIEADTLDDAKARLISDLSDHSSLHIFDVTINDECVEINEDVELPHEASSRGFLERRARRPLLTALSEALSLDDERRETDAEDSYRIFKLRQTIEAIITNAQE